MKIVKTKKLKLRTKAAKIAYLKRSAAAKAVHHRRKIRTHARIHFAVMTLLVVTGLSIGTAFALRAGDLIPPPGNQADVDVYIRAAQAASKNRRVVASAPKPPDQIGSASWYAIGLRSPDALTCASTVFPRGTNLRVRDLRNGREVICLVNDYGPAKGTHRVIDLSRGSYRALEGLGSGTAPVEIYKVN